MQTLIFFALSLPCPHPRTSVRRKHYQFLPGFKTPVCAMGPSGTTRLTRTGPPQILIVHPMLPPSLTSVTRFKCESKRRKLFRKSLVSSSRSSFSFAALIASIHSSRSLSVGAASRSRCRYVAASTRNAYGRFLSATYDIFVIVERKTRSRDRTGRGVFDDDCDGCDGCGAGCAGCGGGVPDDWSLRVRERMSSPLK